MVVVEGVLVSIGAGSITSCRPRLGLSLRWPDKAEAVREFPAPPLPARCIATPPKAVSVLPPPDAPGAVTVEPLTFFIWLRTCSKCLSYNHAACCNRNVGGTWNFEASSTQLRSLVFEDLEITFHSWRSFSASHCACGGSTKLPRGNGSRIRAVNCVEAMMRVNDAGRECKRVVMDNAAMRLMSANRGAGSQTSAKHTQEYHYIAVIGILSTWHFFALCKLEDTSSAQQQRSIKMCEAL